MSGKNFWLSVHCIPIRYISEPSSASSFAKIGDVRETLTSAGSKLALITYPPPEAYGL